MAIPRLNQIVENEFLILPHITLNCKNKNNKKNEDNCIHD